MTGAEYALLEPGLPDRAPQRGGRWSDHRLVIDGIRWRTRTGAPWRDLPARYGPWPTVYSRHRRWSADGTWARLLDQLRVEADRDAGALDAAGEWVVSVDSTVVRAHADAAGARHALPKDVPAALLEELAAAVPAGPARPAGRSPTSPAASSPAASSPADQATSASSADPQAGTDAGGPGRGAPGGERPPGAGPGAHRP